MIKLALVVVGGLNWGFVGLFGFDLVVAIFGPGSGLSRIEYILVGVSAAWQIMPLLSSMSYYGLATKRARWHRSEAAG